MRDALFTRVRGETVWKFRRGPKQELRGRREGAKGAIYVALPLQRLTIQTPQAIFQTVSEGEFSEVRIPGSATPFVSGRGVVASSPSMEMRSMKNAETRWWVIASWVVVAAVLVGLLLGGVL